MKSYLHTSEMTENFNCDLRNIGTKTTEKNCHHQLHQGHCTIYNSRNLCVSLTSSQALCPIYNSRNLCVCVPPILSRALCTIYSSSNLYLCVSLTFYSFSQLLKHLIVFYILLCCVMLLCNDCSIVFIY